MKKRLPFANIFSPEYVGRCMTSLVRSWSLDISFLQLFLLDFTSSRVIQLIIRLLCLLCQLCRPRSVPAEGRRSFITTTVREQRPRSHLKGATGRVRTGDQRYPVYAIANSSRECPGTVGNPFFFNGMAVTITIECAHIASKFR